MSHWLINKIFVESAETYIDARIGELSVVRTRSVPEFVGGQVVLLKFAIAPGSGLSWGGPWGVPDDMALVQIDLDDIQFQVVGNVRARAAAIHSDNRCLSYVISTDPRLHGMSLHADCKRVIEMSESA